MKEPRSLTNRAQYTLVYRQGKVWSTSLLMMKAMPNTLNLSRYGFSVTKKVGKAVQRNRLRRLLREIMKQQLLRPGWDIVFIVRSVAVNTDYHQLESSVTKLLTRAQLLESNE
ncbi:MAG TPA: ribonuclease P protein component [Dehalococcoidia bacterium]